MLWSRAVRRGVQLIVGSAGLLAMLMFAVGLVRAADPGPLANPIEVYTAAGLFGLVLSWLLLKHLPAKDAQLERLITDHQKQIADITAAHHQEVRELVAAFQLEQRESRQQYKAELADLIASHRQLTQVIHKDLEILGQATGQLFGVGRIGRE